jgi:hypothetical protein
MNDRAEKLKIESKSESKEPDYGEEEELEEGQEKDTGELEEEKLQTKTGDNDIPIEVIDDVNKDVSSTSYKRQKLSPLYKALEKQGFKITSYEDSRRRLG